MNELRDIAADLVELAEREGAEDVVAEAVDTSTQQIRFSNSQIDTGNAWNERHVVLFVAIGKRTLATDIRDLANANRLATQLVDGVKRAPENKGYGGIGSGRFRYTSRKADRRLVQLRDPSKFVHEAIAGAESAGADNVGGTLYLRHELTGIASSGGAHASDENASLELSVRAFSQPEASGHSVCCTPRLSGMKARQAGERAGELSVMAKNPLQGHEGRFDIIVEPLFLGSLMHFTQRMLSGLVVEIGLSMYAKKLGKRVASEEITLVDDPTIDSVSRRAFDHEGVPTRRNVLIKDGVLKSYLHNTSTARRFKTRTTASAGPLIPTLFIYTAQPLAFHPVLESGDWDVDEMIADTKHGLYMNNTWYTRFQNYATGEFSTIPRDAILQIENGEIVGAVKNIRISDNMMAFWKGADALSESSQEVYWWDEASPPSTLATLRSRSMNITRSS